YELTGETGKRLEPTELAVVSLDRLPVPGRVYARRDGVAGGEATLRSLHPLVVYDPDGDKVLFVDLPPGRRKPEHLSYITGPQKDRANLAGEIQELLARLAGPGATEAPAPEPTPEPLQPETPAVEPARCLGDFELLSVLGKGGMGKVHRAWQA